MFKNLEVLDSIKHSDLTYKGHPGYGFARTLAHSPLAADEIVQASKFFPVVFPTEGRLLPVALLSLKKECCAFVKQDNSWNADFIPSHIRRYPFMLGSADNSDKFLLMIDRDAPQFAETDGERLFIEGRAAEKGIVSTALDYLRDFHTRLASTERLLAPLREHNLLVIRRFEVNEDGNKTVAVDRFCQVDEKALFKLSDEILANWVRSGLMSVVAAHLHSLNNVERIYRLQYETAKASSLMEEAGA